MLVPGIRCRAEQLLLAALAAGCAASHPVPELAPGTPGYRPPSRFTIVGETEPSFDVQELFIANNSSASVIITSVQITDCVNVEPCGLVALQIRVDPTQRRHILDVKPVVTSEEWSYKWNYTWSGMPGR